MRCAEPKPNIRHVKLDPELGREGRGFHEEDTRYGIHRDRHRMHPVHHVRMGLLAPQFSCASHRASVAALLGSRYGAHRDLYEGRQMTIDFIFGMIAGVLTYFSIHCILRKFFCHFPTITICEHCSPEAVFCKCTCGESICFLGADKWDKAYQWTGKHASARQDYKRSGQPYWRARV